VIDLRNYLVFFILLVVLLVGCTQPTPEEIVEKMQEKYESIKDMKGEMVVTTIVDGGKESYAIKFEMKKPNKWKSEDDNMLTVSNGKTMWVYYKQKREVTKLSLPEIKQPEFDYGKIIRNMFEEYDVKLLGEEKVSGRDCYVIEMKPKNESYFVNQKLWVDRDYWYPIKIEINFGNFSSTVEYRNIEFNTGIEDGNFEFIPPKGVKVIEKEFKLPEKLTIEEARKRLNFTIVTPKYTAGFNFSHAIVINDMVQLYYKRGEDVLIISERISKNTPLPSAKKVKIKDTEGEMAEVFGSRILRFSLKDVEVSISGKLSEEEIVKVAGSMIT
jgi:outer membrane lipoprotein-sorting protein